ncbi:uncharacterized protein DFL_009020 [Arthrobotrys flagrans]|uniref:Uncharacterized protein n=1 Tax=Arthrobotrys flagrans TaxID=97331 RepID=A0A436ZQH2_ARTFL|nr:hypothetical protein DFL_009020 [Arthrobotrys flagrans]
MATAISLMTPSLHYLCSKLSDFSTSSKPLISYIRNPKTYAMSLQTLLKTIVPTKNQLCFHATLIRRHSQPFLFFLENYKGAPHFRHWKRFNPYRKNCLKVLLEVFENAIEEVERDEEVVAEYLRGGFGKCVFGVFGGCGGEVGEVVLRWSIEIRNRRLGRLILDSWTQETNAATGEPEGSGSCDIKDAIHLMAAVWEEESEKGYHHHSGVPEEAGANGGWSGGEGRSEHWEYEEEEEEEEEEFEAWRPFMGPPCLKRKDALHLVYRI